MHNDNQAGLMIVLTAPSGTGKTTVARQVFERDARLAFSVSHTTRARREGEVDGVNYHFIDDAAFDEMVRTDAFAEWAHVHGQRYGTSHGEIRRLWAAGKDILFDVDPQGGVPLKAAYPDAITIFMVPPSLESLAARLKGRGTETDEQVALRLANAHGELKVAPAYDYVLANTHVDKTADSFLSIIEAERHRTRRQLPLLQQLKRALPHQTEK